MRTFILALAFTVATAAALPSPADDAGEIPVTLAVGDSVLVGPPPVRQAICDDGDVVELIDTAQGPALRGRKPGTTVCSFLNALSIRQVYRVTVIGSPEDGAGGGSSAPARTP